MIYTKNGDNSFTRLGNGGVISKGDTHIIACGSIDELNSILGVVKAYLDTSAKFNQIAEKVLRVQREIMQVNSLLMYAITPEATNIDVAVSRLEKEIDAMIDNVQDMHAFLVPGNNKITAFIHVARAVCRRAESHVVQIELTKEVAKLIIPYLNRLSDWLFAIICFVEENYVK